MNTPSVKAIDRRSVHQICSGQVVVTLSTALKELVENSLDAGATNIEIRLRNSGADCIEVIDNGSGVLPENFQALALKHHTSKLNVFADLVGVETFGFRGEALSSLCALSDLCITTCHHSKSIGAKIEYDHDGKITKETPMARVPGTTVTLHNLFSTLPVRHKEFLRNLKREYAKLIQVLQGYAVISTAVKLNCYTQSEKGKKNVVLSTNGNTKVKENISNIFGPKQLQSLSEFKQIIPKQEDCEEIGLDVTNLDENPVFNITGFVSNCVHGSGRATTDRQYVFINKRPCDLPKIVRIINDVYHAYNRNQYPFVALNIMLEKELVDVNVTPDKRQVFLQQERLLLATIKSSLKSMYDPGSSSYEITQTTLGKSENNMLENSSFANSIKNRLLMANSKKVSKETQFNSIMNFAKRLKSSHNENEIKVVSDSLEEASKCLKNGIDSENGSDSCVMVNEVGESTAKENSDLDLMSGTEIKNLDRTQIESKESGLIETNDSLQDGNPKGFNIVKNTSVAEFEDINDNCAHENLEKHKRKFNSSLDCPELEVVSNKKIKLEQECRIRNTSNRKSITVNFDMEKLKAKTKSERQESVTKQSNAARDFRATIAPENNESAEQELQRHVTKDMFNKMTILGQFNQGFIISKLKNDLFIIDQHASDEKYNFEEQQKNTILKSQRLISPQSLDLTAVNEGILMDNLEIFKKNGFDFIVDAEAPVSKKVKLISLPVSRNWTFGKSDIDELIFMLSDSPGIMYRPSNVRKMFASRACRMSVMVGTALNQAQMKRIVDHMGEMEHPWNCPHGRPTMRHLINLNMIRK